MVVLGGHRPAEDIYTRIRRTNWAILRRTQPGGGIAYIQSGRYIVIGNAHPPDEMQVVRNDPRHLSGTISRVQFDLFDVSGCHGFNSSGPNQDDFEAEFNTLKLTTFGMPGGFRVRFV